MTCSRPERTFILGSKLARYFFDPSVVIFSAGLVLSLARERDPMEPQSAVIFPSDTSLPDHTVKYLIHLGLALEKMGEKQRQYLKALNSPLLGRIALGVTKLSQLHNIFPPLCYPDRSLKRYNAVVLPAQTPLIGLFLEPKSEQTAYLLIRGQRSSIAMLSAAIAIAKPEIKNRDLAKYLSTAILKSTNVPKDELLRMSLLSRKTMHCDSCAHRRAKYFRHLLLSVNGSKFKTVTFLCEPCADRPVREAFTSNGYFRRILMIHGHKMTFGSKLRIGVIHAGEKRPIGVGPDSEK